VDRYPHVQCVRFILDKQNKDNGGRWNGRQPTNPCGGMTSSRRTALPRDHRRINHFALATLLSPILVIPVPETGSDTAHTPVIVLAVPDPQLNEQRASLAGAKLISGSRRTMTSSPLFPNVERLTRLYPWLSCPG
jgi:hypothetical protein